jgi:hypothetical protein
VLVKDTSATDVAVGFTVVESFARYVSPPPLVVAVFVMASGADWVTLPFTAIAGYEAPEPPSASDRVHVNDGPDWLHVHPVPLTLVADNPYGSVSLTCTWPELLVNPRLLTLRL